jgi:hypothetical protein
MRLRLLLFFFIISVILSISAGKRSEPPAWFKSSARLVYRVNDNYQFIFTLKNLSDGIEFDWEMHDKKPPSAGTIHMKKEALENSTTQFNYYLGGTNVMYDQTAMFVSKLVYSKIKAKGSVLIKPSGVNEILSFRSKCDFKCKINGSLQTFKTLYAETDKGHKYWILDNPAVPLILSMQLDSKIILEEIFYSNK